MKDSYLNVFLNTPIEVSTFARADLCARLYLFSARVIGVLNGVRSHGCMGYALSPKNKNVLII